MEAKMVIQLKGLNCPNCAAKIEKDTTKLSGVQQAEINLMKQEMIVLQQGQQGKNKLFAEIESIVKKYEPDVAVSLEGLNQEAEREEHEAYGHAHSRTQEHSHTHEHSHKEAEAEEDFAKEWRKKGIQFGIGLLLFLAAILPVMEGSLKIALFLGSYFLFGYEVLWTAVKNIGRGQIFDENFLMSLSTIGAIAIGELPEAVFVMLFYQIGESFQELAVHRSRKSIRALMDIRPDAANLITEQGSVVVDPADVSAGDKILVKPGEKIPLDGIVLAGEAFIDTSAMTGESVPRKTTVGDTVLSGTIDVSGLLTITVTKPFAESTAVRILELVENSAAKKSKTEQFITRFARVYTPAVVLAALALAVLPPLLGAEGGFSMWISRALIFLVISCPCALVLSVPLGFFSGIGEGSKQGVLIKGSNYMQALKEVKTVVFDKTGTLTMGVFEVTEIHAENGFSEEEVLRLAAYSEKMSNHPIARSITKAYEKEQGSIPEGIALRYEEISGFGIHATIENMEIYAGNAKLLKKNHISFEPYQGSGSIVYVAVDQKYAGYVVVSDRIKEGSREAIAKLKELGVTQTVMLSGDNRQTAEAVAKNLGIDTVYAELLPNQKVEKLEALFAKKKETEKIAFVGDGVNDAPVLARADVGIAMGGMGSDAAIEAADVVIMDDRLTKIPIGIQIAKKTNEIVMQNIIFALAVKAIVLFLGAVGIASMWMAVFADVGVAFLAIVNAMRKKV